MTVRHELKVKNAVLSFPALFEKHSVGDGPGKYGCSILLDITIAEAKAQVDNLGKLIKKMMADPELKGKTVRKPPMHKGWEKYPDDERYENIIILNTYARDKPDTVDAKRRTVEDKSVFYPGSICNFALSLYSHPRPVLQLCFGLEGIQWIGHGDRLDSRPNREAMFDEVDGADLPDADDGGKFDDEQPDDDDSYSWM